ncbi:MAG TPA: L,D-transpeptidase family protein [Dermatophilaceae bacterium]|nr:L,D-transpeptidase family protein [Dermatophilaceae bacterium]
MELTRSVDVDRRTLVLGAATAAAVGTIGVVGAPDAEAVTYPTLRRGSRGSSVLTLQRRLNALGYWCGTADGSFGRLTQQAVWALQKAAGIPRTGVVASRTWSALNRRVRPAKRTTSGSALEVNKSRQLLLVVQDGRLKYILNTSTGSGERYYSGGAWHTARTPTGRFRIYRRISSGWHRAPLGMLYRPVYFTGGYAIHGSTSIPPYPASHGCCRLSTAAMDVLWREGRVPIGRRVRVY